MGKAELRKKFLAMRKDFSEQEIEFLSGKINKRLIDFLEVNPDLRHIHIFLTIKKMNEVDTAPLVNRLLEEGYHLYTSTLSTDFKSLLTLRLLDQGNYISDKWSIPVPKEILPADKIDIQAIIVPLLVYDKTGNRLGYGKGFYDGYLDTLSKNVLKIGLSFFPPVETVFPEAHDIALDYCITPNKCYKF
jgi:5-formyltetrahydrofolate cyclo-ligase